MSLPVTLKALRKKYNITQEELARQIGVERSSVGKYETGTIPSMEVLTLIAEYFDVSVDYLLGRNPAPTHIPGAIPLTSVTYIPLLGTIACGKPILAEENIHKRILLPDEIKADFALRCKGDSMIDADIDDGDIVYIRQQPVVENGEIAAVLISSDAEPVATLKKVYVSADSLTLTPCNDDYIPLTFVKKEMNSVTILGKVVAVLKIMRK